MSLGFAFIKLAIYPSYFCLHIPMVQLKQCLISILLLIQVTEVPLLWGLLDRDRKERTLKTSSLQNEWMLSVTISSPCGK